MNAEVLSSFDNGVCESIILHIRHLNHVIVLVYRPPDTRLSELSEMLLAIDNTLADLPSPVPTISLMGELNFPGTVVTWEEPEEGLLVPLVAGHREGETGGGKQERLQAQKVMDLALKYGMIQ